MIIWLTGQPGAGKTTIALELVKSLPTETTVHIDGDDLRDIFVNKDYSELGRRRNIERAQDIALFLHTKGYTVIVSLVSPYKDQRDTFKELNGVIEVYVHTTEIRGRESYHVLNYEPPTENFIDLDTTNQTIEDSVNKLIKKIPNE
jgi:adenylylsulfate kinase-like enzyme